MPEPGRIVIANTTPIISLALIGKLDLLQQLYGQVFIPPAVKDEIVIGGESRIGTTELKDATYIQTKSLSDPGRPDLITDLDRGEAEVIALAQELNADLVLIDERLARWHARRLGLNITGVLGVLLRSKERGFLEEIKPLVEQLEKGGIWLGPKLVSEVLRLAKELE